MHLLRMLCQLLCQQFACNALEACAALVALNIAFFMLFLITDKNNLDFKAYVVCCDSHLNPNTRVAIGHCKASLTVSNVN